MQQQLALHSQGAGCRCRVQGSALAGKGEGTAASTWFSNDLYVQTWHPGCASLTSELTASVKVIDD
jgi:hypothetical protein